MLIVSCNRRVVFLGRDAVLVGRGELAPDDKQRDRRAKKAARRKARSEDKQQWKATLKANPGLAAKVTPACAVIFDRLCSCERSGAWLVCV